MFSAPGPPGPHFYLKVPIFTPFHQNGGEIPIFHLQTAFWGVESHVCGWNNKGRDEIIGYSKVWEHDIFMKSSENSWKVENLCDFHGISIKSRNHIAKWNFREAETPKSAKSTKPYKLLGQIDEFSPEFHFLKKIPTFSSKMTFPRKMFSSRKHASIMEK